MDHIKGSNIKTPCTLCEIRQAAAEGKDVLFRGMVHNIRDMGDFSFVIIRKFDGMVQCVYTKDCADASIENLAEESSVEITGTPVPDDRAPNGVEVQLKSIKVLTKPYAPAPLTINKWKLTASLETNLNNRPAALRNNRQRAVFLLQEGIARGFREFLHANHFTEVHTPKIVATGAEGGANIFKLDYFEKKAFLAQSPQFYKQALIPVYERVFEIGPVFRAEKHNTARHLNEYTSMDFEMAFIESFYDIMEMEAGFLKYALSLLQTDYAAQLKILGVKLPNADSIPSVRFKDAKEMVAEAYNRKIKNPFDLEPEEEQLISKLFKEKYNADFVFVTHYPSKKRPFYAMDDPEDDKYTLSFDLLYDGMEITTGGQRIHSYEEQVDKLKRKGLDPADFESYLMAHKYGMPPHGGLGIGLERVCMKLIGETNIRCATLFPRDMNRLTP